MLKLVVLFCLVALISGGTVPVERSGRIVGGTTAASGQFRYIASLRTTANVHFCGGTLFSPRWIVTAAHCTFTRTTGTIIVVLGAINRSLGGTTYSITTIINHPQFNANTQANDISLIETLVNVPQTDTIAPAVLGSAFIGGGVAVVTSGWGQTSHPGSNPANLQFVRLTTLTNADCRARFSVSNANRVFDNTICTFTRAGEGTCMGDSGGPLAIDNTVIGLVSWQIPCATGSPDVFVRTSSHRAWILSMTGV